MIKEEPSHPLSKIWETIINELRSKHFWLILALFIGLLFATRFALTKDDHVHYHANFAIFINSKQEKFESPLYYEEVQSCSSEDEDNPLHRAHMHGNVNSVVHVHAHAVTWGHFFNNIGVGLTKNLIETEQGIYIDDEGDQQLTFYLNGQEVDSVTNKLINSEDTLLIDYGKPNKERLEQQYASIQNLAQEANNTQDPASCSGSGQNSKEKLINAIKFWQ